MQQEQQTALHIAARLGAVDCMLLLLENGANPDAATIEQYTALHIAAKEGHEDVVQLLLDRGADSGLVTSVSIYVNLIFTTLFSYHYHVITVAQRGWAGCCFWLQHCVCLFVTTADLVADFPRQQWSLLNHFCTEQGHFSACRRKWRLKARL